MGKLYLIQCNAIDLRMQCWACNAFHAWKNKVKSVYLQTTAREIKFISLMNSLKSFESILQVVTAITRRQRNISFFQLISASSPYSIHRLSANKHRLTQFIWLVMSSASSRYVRLLHTCSELATAPISSPRLWATWDVDVLSRMNSANLAGSAGCSVIQ